MSSSSPLGMAAQIAPRRAFGIISSALVVFLTLAGQLVAAEPAKARPFDIPAGNAITALKQFAEQSGAQIVFSTDELGGMKTNAVRGPMTPPQALAQMLAGTSLTFSHDEKTGAIAVGRADPPRSSDSAEKNGASRTPRLPRAPADDNAKVLAEEAVTLSPFEVTAAADRGYAATETLAGTRLKTDLKDVATQVNVMTKELLDDLAITNLDDAMRYSLNTETREEAEDVNDPTSFGLSDTLNYIGSGQGGRTRGLAAPNNSHDFFDTFVRMDSYNTERFTFSSGPNSILFGNSSPAGTIDTTLKRARTDKRFFEVSNRVTSNEGVRFSTDLNVPVFRSIFAVRAAGLRDRDKTWREPGFNNSDRVYAAFTITPFRQLTIRGYNENAKIHNQPVKNTLMQDHVTPWIQAGKPLFNNGGTGPLPAFAATGVLSQTQINLNRAIMMFDASGFLGFPITTNSNLARAKGYDEMSPAPNNFERSILDQSLYPFDVNFSGNTAQVRSKSWIRGLIVETNPIRNFFVEAAINEEKMRNKAIDWLNNDVQELNVDVNMFLQDRVTPNPMVGRYYLENAKGGRNSNMTKSLGNKEQKRLSASYELNFEEHQGWTKWLGTHRVAYLLDRLQSTRVQLLSPVDYSPSTPVTAYPFFSADGNSRFSTFRYYVDPAHMAINLPFDPLAEGPYTDPGWRAPNGQQVSVAAFHPSVSNAAGVPTTARTEVDSTAFVTQSYLLNRRLIVGYARRRDVVENFTHVNFPTQQWNFDDVLTRLVWTSQRREAPVKTIKSAVAHPLPWISFAYAETGSQQVRTEIARDLDGVIAKLGGGVGKDYGVTLRWRNLFSIRINKYTNTAKGTISGYGGNFATPTATFGSFGNRLKTTVAGMERGIQVYAPDFDPTKVQQANPNNPMVAPASTLSPRFAAYQQDLAFNTVPTVGIGGTVNSRYEVYSDKQATGYEVTLISNPLSNWRIAVTGAQNKSVETNIGGQWWDFIKERLPVWGAAGNLDRFVPQTATLVGGLNALAEKNFINGTTYRQALMAGAQSWNYIRQSDGHLNNNVRKHRLTATTRYTFDRSRLKGAFVGGNYSWRSGAAVGYAKKTITDNEFVVPGVVSSTLEVDDLDHPYLAGALTSFDAFLGYSRRLFEGKVHWRCQLNVRNVLDRQDPLVQKTLTDGSGAIFTVQEPRSFILTNTFSF